jgi:hypothetical protein
MMVRHAHSGSRKRACICTGPGTRRTTFDNFFRVNQSFTA